MATEVDRLIVTLEARLGAYEANMRRGQQVTAQRLGAMEARFAAFSRNVNNSASSAAIGMGAALGGLGAYLGVRQLQEYADGWTTITRALTAGEEVFGMRLRSAEELNRLANESRVDNEAYAKLYIRTAAATRELGVAEADVAKVTTTVAQALKLGSASASEQASTMLQLSQALQKGKLDGDEFRTVMENAGIIQELLADKLKVSKGAIIEMAAAGKLKVGELFAALRDGGEKVNRIFQQMPTTIDEAFTVLRNSVEQYIGNLDKASGASKSFTGLLGAMARNMETVGDAALTLGAALLATFGGGALRTLVAISSRLVTLPGLLAGGAAAAVLFGDQATLNMDIFNQRLAQGADLATAMHGALNDASAGVPTIAEHFRALGIVIGEDLMASITTIASALTGQEISWDQLKGAALRAVQGIVGGVKTMVTLIGAAPQGLYLYGKMAIERFGNAIISGLQRVIDLAVAGINKLMDAFEMLPDWIVSKSERIKAPKLELFDEKGTIDGISAFSREVDRSIDANFDFERYNAKAKELAMQRLTLQWAPVNTPTAKPVYPGGGGDGKNKKSPFDREVRQVEESIRALEMESRMLGSSAFEAERARAAQDLLNAAKREGLKITPQLLSQIDQLSTAYATAKTEAERLKETFEEIKSFSSDALKGFITDLKEGKSGSEALSGALDKLANKLIDMAVNALVQDALGPLIGSALGGGFGAGSAVAFGFADGGIASNGRPVPLPRFAGGGVSRSAAIFGEAGPEAAVPLPDGRRIPVDLRIPRLPDVAGMAQGGRVVVAVEASSELDARIKSVSGAAVADGISRAAPEIVKASVGATEKAFPGMIGRAQKRKL